MDFSCWNVFYWSRNNIVQYVNHFTLQIKNIKISLHLVATKFYQWNECFARSLWSLASLWDHFVLNGCKSRCSHTTLTLIWLCFHFIHKMWLVQDIISNMVVVFMSLFMVLFIFFVIFRCKILIVFKNNQFEYNVKVNSNIHFYKEYTSTLVI